MIGNNDQKKITAYTIADGWYDSSNNYRPEIKEGREVCVKNIAGYLDGSCDAFEINTPENAEEIAAKIYDCLSDWEKAERGELDGFTSGEWTQNWYWLVEKPLKEIEL